MMSKGGKTALTIGIVILVIIILGVAGYFAYKWWKGKQTPVPEPIPPSTDGNGNGNGDDEEEDEDEDEDEEDRNFSLGRNSNNNTMKEIRDKIRERKGKVYLGTIPDSKTRTERIMKLVFYNNNMRNGKYYLYFKDENNTNINGMNVPKNIVQIGCFSLNENQNLVFHNPVYGGPDSPNIVVNNCWKEIGSKSATFSVGRTQNFSDLQLVVQNTNKNNILDFQNGDEINLTQILKKKRNTNA